MPPYNPPSITASLCAYLNQWVKIASGDRVKLTGGISLPVHPSSTTNSGYFVFRCTECADNWHVGHENFQGNVQDPAAITVPSVLSEWVKKHRHVCKKYKDGADELPQFVSKSTLCGNCKWPYGAHEESWIANQVFDEQGKPVDVKWMNIWNVGPKSFVNYPPKPDSSQWGDYEDPPSRPHPTSMTLKQFTGRKFRDAETEDTCESQDTNTPKTSKE